MSNNTPMELNGSWVCQHLSDVTTHSTAWVLLQEPGFIGFGVVQQDKIFWPPNMPWHWTPDWRRVHDLRLFGKKGEWHVWLDSDGKHQCRLLEFNEKNEWHLWLGWKGKNQCRPEKSGKKVDVLREYHALWGSKVKRGKSAWIRLIEDRGVEIWLPLKGLKDADLPLRLELKQIIDYDPKYRLAGIVDAALVGIVQTNSGA